MKKQEELVIITKTYDLILWSCNHTGRFPAVASHSQEFDRLTAKEKATEAARAAPVASKN